MKQYKFKAHNDSRGSLITIEGVHDIPFEIKRVYFMYNIGLNQVRGCHAHRTLQQVLICINGKCSIALDDAHSREVLVLSRGDQGIYIGPYIWHEIYNCTNNTIILALASDYYDESDYIRDYKEFLNFVSSNKEGSL